MAYGHRRLIYRSLWADADAAMLDDREFNLLVLMLVATDDHGYGECNPGSMPYEACRRKPRGDVDAVKLLRSVNRTSTVEVRTDWNGGPARKAKWLYRVPKFERAQRLRKERTRASKLEKEFNRLTPLDEEEQ